MYQQYRQLHYELRILPTSDRIKKTDIKFPQLTRNNMNRHRLGHKNIDIRMER